MSTKTLNKKLFKDKQSKAMKDLQTHVLLSNIYNLLLIKYILYY